MKKVFLVMLLMSSVIHADVFSKGKKNVGVYLGSGTTLNKNYTIFGLSGEYFVADNLAVGAMYRAWFGNDPSQNELSGYANYFIPLNEKIKPYVGAFARKTYVSSDLINDYASYGARAGLGFITSANSYVSLGYVIEYFDTCIGNEDCYRTYPELSVGISF